MLYLWIGTLCFIVGCMIGAMIAGISRKDLENRGISTDSRLSDRTWNQINDPVLLYLKEKDRRNPKAR